MAEAYRERVYERMERPVYDRTIPGILSDLLTQFTTLIRQESELARTEMSEKVSRATMGAAMAGAAAVLLIPSLVILMMAGVYGIAVAANWPQWASALLVGGVFLLIGAILLAVGMSRLKTRALLPDKTINQLQEDAAMAKRQMQTEPVVEPEVRSRDGYERAA
jgi:membrane protein implicated in regulation of membrane protease activity